MDQRHQAALTWIGGNVIAAAVFVLATSSYWVPEELREFPGASGGDAVLWFFVAAGIAVFALLINAMPIFRACVSRVRTGVWPASAIAWLSALVWGGAILFDSARHGA